MYLNDPIGEPDPEIRVFWHPSLGPPEDVDPVETTSLWVERTDDRVDDALEQVSRAREHIMKTAVFVRTHAVDIQTRREAGDLLTKCLLRRG
jgi:hypothetical protein